MNKRQDKNQFVRFLLQTIDNKCKLYTYLTGKSILEGRTRETDAPQQLPKNSSQACNCCWTATAVVYNCFIVAATVVYNSCRKIAAWPPNRSKYSSFIFNNYRILLLSYTTAVGKQQLHCRTAVGWQQPCLMAADPSQQHPLGHLRRLILSYTGRQHCLDFDKELQIGISNFSMQS